MAYVGWEFDGGHVEANREQGRLQVFFDGKPEADARQQLKEHGFRWAPSVGAWQRLLNDNAYYASDRIACIQPLSGIKPTELQRNSNRKQQAQAAQEQAEPDYFYRVHANPRSDSRENLYILQAYIPQDNGRAKIGDVLYVGTPERCRELMDQLNTGELTQEAVKELYAKEQEPTPEQEPAPEPEPETAPEQETEPAGEGESDRNALVMDHVRKYMEDNYMADLSLDSVSEILHISPAYLSAQFKKYQKMNFLDCLTELRINAAKELLADPFRSAAEVASMVGYEDASYFARAFKKRTGMTPTQYRKEAAKAAREARL